MPNEAKKKMTCPECGQEVELADPVSDTECGKCGLEIGRVMTFRRIQKAAQKMDEAENPPAKKKKVSLF